MKRAPSPDIHPVLKQHGPQAAWRRGHAACQWWWENGFASAEDRAGRLLARPPIRAAAELLLADRLGLFRGAATPAGRGSGPAPDGTRRRAVPLPGYYPPRHGPPGPRRWRCGSTHRGPAGASSGGGAEARSPSALPTSQGASRGRGCRPSCRRCGYSPSRAAGPPERFRPGRARCPQPSTSCPACGRGCTSPPWTICSPATTAARSSPPG